jgi:hypothetical protein
MVIPSSSWIFSTCPKVVRTSTASQRLDRPLHVTTGLGRLSGQLVKGVLGLREERLILSKVSSFFDKDKHHLSTIRCEQASGKLSIIAYNTELHYAKTKCHFVRVRGSNTFIPTNNYRSLRTFRSNNCDTSVNYNEGCGVVFPQQTSYGVGFNNVGGGWYVPRHLKAPSLEMTLWV